jgi:hypothetical protein
MMKSAENRPRGELTKPLNGPTVRRILVQRQMRSVFVVIAGVGTKDSTQVAGAEDDDVIEAIPADRADQPRFRDVRCGSLVNIGAVLYDVRFAFSSGQPFKPSRCRLCDRADISAPPRPRHCPAG